MSKSYPEPIAGALIVNPQNKIFLMQSHKFKNKWQIPGGHIELGETVEEALKREIKEETKMDIFDIQFLNLQESVFEKTFYKKKHMIYLNFLCRTKNSDVTLDQCEAQKYIWITPKEALAKLDLEKHTRKTIDDSLKLLIRNS